jgi:hypothetical protein
MDARVRRAHNHFINAPRPRRRPPRKPFHTLSQLRSKIRRTHTKEAPVSVTARRAAVSDVCLLFALSPPSLSIRS